VTLLLDLDRVGLRLAEQGSPADAWVVKRSDGSLDQCLEILGAAVMTPDRVLATPVSGSLLARHLDDVVRRRWGISVEWADQCDALVKFREQHGVPPTVDAQRCLGLIGARPRRAGVWLLAYVGEAVTVDMIDQRGCHRSDVFLPGERLLREALYAQTSGVAAAALLDEAATDGVFGINTAGAVRQGARLFLAAVLDRLAADALDLADASARVALTGPLAAEIAPLLRGPFDLYPDLVLRTLARIAGREGE
jgi:type III pantothenate kinase